MLWLHRTSLQHRSELRRCSTNSTLRCRRVSLWPMGSYTVVARSTERQQKPRDQVQICGGARRAQGRTSYVGDVGELDFWSPSMCNVGHFLLSAYCRCSKEAVARFLGRCCDLLFDLYRVEQCSPQFGAAECLECTTVAAPVSRSDRCSRSC